LALDLIINAMIMKNRNIPRLISIAHHFSGLSMKKMQKARQPIRMRRAKQITKLALGDENLLSL
jgi:hypothetical protein